jgi:hypothetical protein
VATPMTNGCEKQTGCKECDKMPHTELCPIHTLEMISAQMTFWTNKAVETLKKIKEQENAKCR